jgi:hypothetical protein
MSYYWYGSFAVVALVLCAGTWLVLRRMPQLLAMHPKAAEIVMKLMSAFDP